jgi:hypothetical protein
MSNETQETTRPLRAHDLESSQSVRGRPKLENPEIHKLRQTLKALRACSDPGISRAKWNSRYPEFKDWTEEDLRTELLLRLVDLVLMINQ